MSDTPTIQNQISNAGSRPKNKPNVTIDLPQEGLSAVVEQFMQKGNAGKPILVDSSRLPTGPKQAGGRVDVREV